MTRKQTAGMAERNNQTNGGAVTAAELENIRQQPDINAAIRALHPYSNAVLGLVRSLAVRNPMERHIMADVLRQVKTAQAAVDARFDPITKPMWAAWRAATGWRSEVRGPLELAEQCAKTKLEAYELDVRSAAAAAAAVAAQQAQAQAQAQAQNQIHTQTGFGGTGGIYTPVATPNAPTTWEHIAPPAATLPALQGVSTATKWTVDIVDERAAVECLIVSGAYQLGPFVRLDVSALQIAVRGNGDNTDTTVHAMRQVLGQVPGLKVGEITSTRARGYGLRD